MQPAATLAATLTAAASLPAAQQRSASSSSLSFPLRVCVRRRTHTHTHSLGQACARSLPLLSLINQIAKIVISCELLKHKQGNFIKFVNYGLII